MKRKMFISIMLVVILTINCVVSFAGVSDTRACQHHYVYDNTDYSGYGSMHYYTVQYCPYVSYSHRHYHLGGTATYTYICEYCGAVKTITQNYIDYEAGDFCTLHDVGKKINFEK